MRKTTIELISDQCFFLKEKALELQKRNQNASIVSIIRDLIEKDRQEWARGKKKNTRLKGQSTPVGRTGDKADG